MLNERLEQIFADHKIMALAISFQMKNRSISVVAAKPTTSEHEVVVSAAEMDTSLSFMRTVSMTWT